MAFTFKGANRTLSNEEDGTFLLRQNKIEELRFSYKCNLKVCHTKIIEEDRMFRTQHGDQRLCVSIERLVEHLQEINFFRYNISILSLKLILTY